MENILQQRIISGDSIFGNGLLDSRTFYLYHSNSIPNVHFINTVNTEKAMEAFLKVFADRVLKVYRNMDMPSRGKKYMLNTALVLLNNGCMVEFAGEYCEILHDGKAEATVNEITALVSRYRKRGKRQPYEISLITSGEHGLQLKRMPFKKTKLDLELYYEDDFAAVDSIIYKRLNTNNDKGIVLLHGLPGTGKTTYLRYLIGRLRKRVLFLSPAVAENIIQPNFIDLLIANPNSILVIEDAENIIRDRKLAGSSSVSGLLNLSDGLLADCMNVQVVCTFNSDISQVDSALMRKGRLIAKYEFGKLSVAKAQRLSAQQGFDAVIHRPMTIAEIMNQHEPSFEQQHKAIGFRSVLQEA